MNQPINEFRDVYRFLSNFYPYEIVFLDYPCPSNEHGYQLAKTLDPDERRYVLSQATPGAAKRAGREVTLRPDWEAVKVPIMRQLTELKFIHPGQSLSRKLLLTGDAVLREGNTWGDTFWGVCNGEGDNWLGHLLMARRAELRALAAVGHA